MNISEAEKQITLVLKQLEIDTSFIVEAVNIKQIDVSVMGDRVSQIRKAVKVDLRRAPGYGWSV